MRRLAWFSAGFSGGVFLGQYLLPENRLLPGAFMALALGFASLILPWWNLRRRAAVLCAALALGLGYNWLYIRQVQRPAEALLSPEDGVHTALLLEYPRESDFGARVTVKLEGVPGKAVYYGGRDLLSLEPGQTLSGPLRLQSAARIRDGDVTAFTSDGVFLLAYGRDNPAAGQGSAASLRWLPAAAGRAMREEIALLFQGDDAGFLAAVLTGDRSGLSEEARIALSEAGLAHILAVSGMHCAMLLALISFIIGKHRRRALFFCAVPLLGFYTLLSGSSPSALRACIMLSFLLAGPLFRRESDGPTSLLAALMLILLANPFAAASVSLQLSFAAMAGILWLTPRLSALMPEPWSRRGPLRAVWLSLSVTLGALLFSAPLSAIYFGTLSLLSPLSSLLCLWAAGAALSLGMLAVLSGLVCPPLGRLLALPASLLIRYILGTAGLLARLPGHGISFSNPYARYWLIYVYLLFAALFLTKRVTRRSCLLAAGLAALTLTLSLKLGAARYGADLNMTVLDVGQGQSVILSSGEAFALVDCGSGNGWKDAGETAARYLRGMGCGRLDYLILTHYDSDHVSGVPGLLARLEAKRLLVPDTTDGAGPRPGVLASAESRGGKIRLVTDVQTLPFGAGSLTVLPPLGGGADNERGLTILATVGDKDVLITGDMDAATERLLLETCELPDTEAMMAGHHGSKHSSSQALLEAAAPETVCISVGSNSYGHPSEEALARLARQGCAIYRTDLHGTIHLSWNREE